MSDIKISTNELAFIREAITQKYENIMNQLVVSDPTWEEVEKISEAEFNKELAKIKKPHWTQTPEGKAKMAKRKKAKK